MSTTTQPVVLAGALVRTSSGEERLFVAADERTLKGVLFREFVLVEWPKKMDRTMPADPEQAVSMYFEMSGDNVKFLPATVGDMACLFRQTPPGKVSVGYVQIGEWDPGDDTYPVEGYVDLMVAPTNNNDVWARVGCNVDELPEQEG